MKSLDLKTSSSKATFEKKNTTQLKRRLRETKVNSKVGPLFHLGISSVNGNFRCKKVIDVTKFWHADLLRARQLIPNRIES